MQLQYTVVDGFYLQEVEQLTQPVGQIRGRSLQKSAIGNYTNEDHCHPR